MKIRTFFISYLLFLGILLAAISTISFYLTQHQMGNIREQNLVEYERIAGTLTREINAVHGRGQPLGSLLQSHIYFQQLQGVNLRIEPSSERMNREIVFESNELEVRSQISTEAGTFLLEIEFDVGEAIGELRQIQDVLLWLFILFSFLSALVLYVVLNWIFRPLEQVTKSAGKIAEGNYQERIHFKGRNELALMTESFNAMAGEIQSQFETLREEAVRKQQFIDNVAHELRTPLTSLYGFAEYMQKIQLSEDDKLAFTTIMMNEADYMKKITNSMLELAKLRNFEPKFEEIELSELFAQLQISLSGTAQNYGIELVILPTHEKMWGQPDLIQSLLTNVCINGIKANSKRVILEAVRGRISVRDDGCGIAPEHIEKVMEPFFQVDKVRNKARGGVGLGLAIVKEIANIHEMGIEITSEINVGTVITFDLTTF